jgi:flap endonuclease-1
MGIRSLNTLIKKYSPESIAENNVDFYSGKKVAIDCSILIYKYVHMQKVPNSHIIGFANRVNYYLKNNILPVFVFDGTPPDAKKNVLQKRQNIRKKIQDKIDDCKLTLDNATTDAEKCKAHAELEKLSSQVVYVNKYHISECKEFLDSIGIPYIQSTGEAEKTCVYLQKINKVDYVVSDDTDTLTFGCTSVLKTNIKDKIYQINLESILSGFQMTYDEFVDFCILSGCDYCPYIPSVGPHTAYNLIKKYSSLEKVIELNKYKIGEDFDYITARHLFKNYDELSFDGDFVKKQLNVDLLIKFMKKLDFKDNLIQKYTKLFC